MKVKKILVTGSLAFDHVMDFPGRFSDHILPDKIHIINVSFLVDTLKKQWGGTAGNIAYNLARLGERPIVLGTAGKDFSPYKKHLRLSGVDVSAVKEYGRDFTPTFFVMTDKSDNQIAGFYLGVMAQARKLSIRKIKERPQLAIISPNDPLAMVKFVGECRQLTLPYIFDPGPQIPRLKPSDIVSCIDGSKILIGNDYEIELLRRKTGMDDKEILQKAEVLIVTQGEKGSQIFTREKKFRIPPVKAKKVTDPTGAGDAYRAGIVKGVISHWNWEKIGRVASLAAVYAVEKYGTQEHFYTYAEFVKRYEKNFGRF